MGVRFYSIHCEQYSLYDMIKPWYLQTILVTLHSFVPLPKKSTTSQFSYLPCNSYNHWQEVYCCHTDTPSRHTSATYRTLHLGIRRHVNMHQIYPCLNLTLKCCPKTRTLACSYIYTYDIQSHYLNENNIHNNERRKYNNVLKCTL